MIKSFKLGWQSNSIFIRLYCLIICTFPIATIKFPPKKVFFYYYAMLIDLRYLFAWTFSLACPPNSGAVEMTLAVVSDAISAAAVLLFLPVLTTAI